MTAPSPFLVDSHCHLNHERLRGDVVELLGRAADASVSRVIVVGYDMASSEEAVELAERHSSVYAAVAIHPHDSKDYCKAFDDRIGELAANPKVVAIGEIGLDYHYNFSPPEAQLIAFRSQMKLAIGAGLPVIIHCREAYAETLEILAEEGVEQIGGEMHCWAGTALEAEKTLNLGMYFGFGGVVTFKNPEETRRILASIPSDRLLLETDAPYLAPVPHRGKRNEPAFVRYVAIKAAELRSVTFNEIALTTTENVERLFGKMKTLK